MGGFSNWFQQNLVGPIRTAMGYHRVPSELKALERLLSEQADILIQQPFPKRIDELDVPLLKRVLLHEKRLRAEQSETLRLRTYHPELLEMVDSDLTFVEAMFRQEWFRVTTARRIPRLTDYLTLKAAYEALRFRPDQVEPKLDEKFGFLQSPTEFIPRLRSCRIEAWLRSNTTSVAFVDIDDFKRFNTKHTETAVDREMLPRVMQELEAHVFSHGWAYRFGGDEYVILLPNTDFAQAEKSLSSLQTKLSTLRFFGDDHITVSIGFCSPGPDSYLTDQEILQSANRAKAFAKNTGKNCIAAYDEAADPAQQFLKVK
jgi:diguanylate cyclase (GGDEF)-like protein